MVMERLRASPAQRLGTDGVAIAARAGALDRARAWLWSGRLDRALADGVASETSPALALRARWLIALPHRRLIAASYQRIVRDASAVADQQRLRVSPNPARVTLARSELLRLAEALALPGPARAQGVAQARLLLTDGAGPLYSRRSSAGLEEQASRATANLGLSTR